MIISCKSCHSIFKFDSSLLKPTGTLIRCSKCQEVYKIYPTKPDDPRKYPRVKTRNLISYFSFDKTSKLISHGLGIALDIGKGGILLETPYSIRSGLLVLAATDRGNNLIEVKGKLIRSTIASTGTYLSGIKFIGVDGRVTKFITSLIREYIFRGNNLFFDVRHKVHKPNLPPFPHNPTPVAGLQLQPK